MPFRNWNLPYTGGRDEDNIIPPVDEIAEITNERLAEKDKIVAPREPDNRLAATVDAIFVSSIGRYALVKDAEKFIILIAMVQQRIMERNPKPGKPVPAWNISGFVKVIGINDATANRKCHQMERDGWVTLKREGRMIWVRPGPRVDQVIDDGRIIQLYEGVMEKWALDVGLCEELSLR